MSIRTIAAWFLGAIIALLAVPAYSLAQGLTEQQKKARAVATELDIDSQELVNLEKETARALLQNSSSFFSHVYSDDYVGVAATGEIRDKSALISSIQYSTIKYSTFVVTNISVRIYGPSAIVTATWSAHGVQDGRSFARQYRVIHVYVNNGHEGAWKVVAGQETMLPGSSIASSIY